MRAVAPWRPTTSGQVKHHADKCRAAVGQDTLLRGNRRGGPLMSWGQCGPFQTVIVKSTPER